ncbi:MAG: hypothetical protein JNL28_12360 [Planctomycetes bacterium]|nr:hypothetical protein [Planctomycetota bacterium]
MKLNTLGLLALYVGIAVSLAAQKPPPKPVPKLKPFIGKLADARALAKDRNVPVLAHILLDAEEASDRYRTDVLTNVALIEKSAECIVIIANNGVHPKKKIEEIVDGEKKQREVCSVFEMYSSCGEHQATWNDLYADVQDPDGTMHCPQTALYAPDGKLTGRINTSQAPAPEEVIAEIVAIQAVAGPGLTDQELETVRKALEAGAKHVAAKAWPDAWKSYAAVLAITKKSPYALEAQKHQPQALAGMKAEFTRISALLVPGTAVKAYQELTAFARDTAGTPLEAEVTARLKKADKDKAIQPEITAWKLSVEADEILRQARDLFEQKQDKKGEWQVRKLFSKKYAGTPAAESARKLWPEIAAEEDAKNPPK